MTTDVDHIADNSELLEEFVLNRLPGQQRALIAAHLQTCSRCAEAVRRERLLVAGVRRAGRDAVKARLRESLAAEDRPLNAAIPWSRVAAMAAVFVVIVGLGMAGRWLYLQQTQSPMPPAVQTPPASKEVARQENNQITTAKKETRPIEHVRTPGPEETLSDNLPERNLQGAEAGAARRAPASADGETSLNRMTAASFPHRRALIIQVETLPPPAAGKGRDEKALPRPTRVTLDSNAVHITLFFPPQDSAMRTMTPTATWVGDDSAVVVIGHREFGVRIRPNE